MSRANPASVTCFSRGRRRESIARASGGSSPIGRIDSTSCSPQLPQNAAPGRSPAPQRGQASVRAVPLPSALTSSLGRAVPVAVRGLSR